MPNTRLYDRKNVAVRSSKQGVVQVAFSSKIATEGWSVGTGGSEDLSTLLAQYPSVYELGRPIQLNTVSADLTVEIEMSVPTGKFWRLIGGFLQYTASGDAATRTPILTIENTGGTAFTTITMATKTQSQVENEHFLFGTDGNVGGNLDVAAQGTLSIDEAMTAGDTFTIGDQGYIMVAGTDQPAHATRKGINMGANEAATKVFIEAEFVDGQHPLVNAIAFNGSGDDMVFTARTPGVAGDSIVFVEDTITNAANVLDGSGTLAGTTSGVDAADDLGDKDYPTLGCLLVATDKIVLNVTNGQSGDAAELVVFALEYDNNPNA